MAETNIWNISSTDDPELHYVTRNDPDDGNYIFTPPESGQITYKITYTNGSATGETIYVVKSTDCYVDPCQNNLNGPTVTFTSPEGATAKTVGSAASSVTVTYDLGECWKFISASRYGEPNNITSFRDSDGKIIYYAANNTTDKVQSDAIYKFRNYAANVTASSYVRIIQESKCASKEPPTLNPLSITNVPISGETYRNKIEFDVTECWYLKSAVTGENWVNLSDDYHTVVVSRNDTASERSTDIVYTFENTEDSTKTTAYTVNVNQLADACIGDTTCPNLRENRYNVSIDGENITVEYTKSLGDCWTVTANKGTGDVGQITNIVTTAKTKSTVSVKANDGERKEMTVIYTFTNISNNTSCDKEITIIQETACRCTCEQIHRTDTDKSYNYNTNAHKDVLFKELGVDSNFSCYDSLEVFKYSEDVGIEEIHYVTGGTIEIDGVTYTKLEIRGSLYELTGGINPKRTMRFGIKVCGEDCTELNPFYVYQRCSCGMDNCRNEYPLEGSTVYEDHPLYCNGCDQDWNGDAICVEKLNLTKVVYYTRSFANEAAIEKDKATNSQKQTVYTGNVWLRNGTNKQSSGTLNPDYVGEENKLVVHESQGQNMFSIYTNYSSTDTGHPLGTSLDYSIEAPSIDLTEQVWEITYTTTSEVIIGGSEDGDCALDTFVVTVYKAPTGWKYNLDLRDRNNKARKKHCD